MSEATIIHVGAKAPEFSSYADFMDGEFAVVRRVNITIEDAGAGGELVITPPEQTPVRWPLADVRTVPDQADRTVLVLAQKNDPVSRLLVTEVEPQRILQARCPNMRKRPPVKGKGRLLAWSVAAMASVALIIGVLVPLMADQLAEYLPPAGEKALGDTTFEQVRAALSENEFAPLRICNNTQGLNALALMQTRLQVRSDLPYPLTVHVLDHDLINAFALPGGHIVLFRGLIDAAETPDEVAAVFAHEIGHVVNRDPTRGALRSAGSIGVLGLVFGDFAGGAAILFMVERLIDATYNQDAEAGADMFAHKTLADVGISPSALGILFERLRAKYGDEDGIVAHFMAHPSLGDRIAAANRAAKSMTGPIRPSLGEEDWQALRKICG